MKLRFLFLGGGPSDALHVELRKLGHEVAAPQRADWYAAGQRGQSPADWADGASADVLGVKPDVLVLTKGIGWWGDRPAWMVPPSFLTWACHRARAALYVSYDDPASTPLVLEARIPDQFDAWLTSCPGIADQHPEIGQLGVRVEEFWLAWDERTELGGVESFADVDLAVTGHPYYRPFPRPHWQHGFGFPRRDLARRALERAQGAPWRGDRPLGLWGAPEWLDGQRGGDPAFAGAYRGWIDPTLVHQVHRSARVTLGTHLCEGRRYDSGRLAWTLGAGGVLLHEDRPGLREEFGDLVAWFPPGNLDTCAGELEALLGDDERRARMAREGRAYVLAHHCWRHRAARMAQVAAEVIAGKG